eukprot:6521253-Pyramimonas_sp.AAC.1
MMVLTSGCNVTTFDKIKDVLIIQHGRIHIHQKGKGESGKKGTSSSTWTQPGPSCQNRSKCKGKARFSRPQGADDGWCEHEEHYPEELSPCGHDASGYAPERGWGDATGGDYADERTYIDEESHAHWAPVQDSSELDVEVVGEMVKAAYADEAVSDLIQEDPVANFGTKGRCKAKGKSGRK